MTEELSSQLPNPSVGAPSSSLISTTLIVYALFGIGAVSALASSGFPLVAPLMGVIGIIALIAAYVKRDEAAGTWLQSHYRWLIRTFWFSFLWGIVGGLILITLGLVLIGIPIAFAIWIATTLWVIYRLVRGYLLFSERKPIPNM
jgi:uncharacterized membrane protein